MQVNSVGFSLQQRCFSKTGSIGGIHLPDFNDIYVYSREKVISATVNIKTD